jgi:hypothetical protein
MLVVIIMTARTGIRQKALVFYYADTLIGWSYREQGLVVPTSTGCSDKGGSLFKIASSAGVD